MTTTKTGLLQAITSRRSTRSFRDEPLSEGTLNEIIEAGRLAPSASNNQSAHFIVVTSPEKLAALREAVTAVLANTPAREGMPPQLLGLIEKARKGTVDVNYGAPALVLVANKKGYVNGMADSACALQNMMLMAAACEVGSCWINQYRLLGEAPVLRNCLLSLGMGEDEEICGAVVLGYSDVLKTEPLPRTGNPVTTA